jgi:hypothetical protein
MSHNVADSTLNLSAQSLALLTLLADTKLHEDIHSETGAWYNGRERGVWLQIGKIGGPQRHIVFCEARSSDKLVVTTWITDHGCMNPPGPGDRPEEAYHAGKYFDYMRLDLAFDYIMDLVR